MILVLAVFLSILSLANSNEDINKPVSSNPPITIPLTKVEVVKKMNKKREAIILDARSFFDFASSHAEKAQSIRWEDYSQTENPHKGLLEPDLNLIARKLRAYGISPESEVIVLGKGRNGYGEEGRIAWMLQYMGIKNVKIKSEENYTSKRVVTTIQANPAAPVWLVKAQEDLRIKMTDLKKLYENKKDSDFVVIDTRSKQEFDEKHLPHAVHIEFKEFIDEKTNEPINAEQLKMLLAKNKINFQTEMIFYCTAGVRSGYATFVVSNNGLKAKHYDGGTDQWFQTGN